MPTSYEVILWHEQRSLLTEFASLKELDAVHPNFKNIDWATIDPKILATSCPYLTRNLNRMDLLTNSNKWYSEVIDGLTRTIYQPIQQVFISMHLCFSWQLWQRRTWTYGSWMSKQHFYMENSRLA
jgi:hypothetical protein